MFSKVTLSTAAALLLFAGVARAAPNDAEFAALESSIPDSIDFPQRMHAARAPSNEEIEALEVGNPDSVSYRDRMNNADALTASDWVALEYGSPDAR
jgi:hypothetical protein